MEEEKVADPPRSQRSDEIQETVFWQWQSGPDPDPWAEKDPAKRTWRDYSDDDCLIIEQAFSLNKEIAELKDYEVDLKKMVQVNKKFKNRVRRVRRQEKSRFMMEMSEPVAVVRDEKTMNQAFGTIQHFLEYIMKRTPEAYGLYQKLKTLRLDSQYSGFEEIIKEVIVCIEKGAETREKVIKTRDGSQATNFLGDAKKIVDVIKMNSTILRDFLKAILKVYTMETFVCPWLNELLRSEDWEEINVFTPYLVCLVYTFKLSELRIQYQEPQVLMNAFRGLFGKQRLYLYRGAALSKEHLELYDRKRIKYFSWNGVTSTSRDENVALEFIKLSLQRTKKLNEPKVRVLFKIETDFASFEDCEGMIDVSPNSRFPEEQEIILAPGTVFKLLKTRLAKNDIYEIDLRVTKKFEETKDNSALLGNLQNETILKDKAIIDGLPSQRSFKVLELLKGNKLIRKLEIMNSGIEEHIMEEIENLRVTTNVRKENITLRNNTIVVSSLGILAHYFSDQNLNDIFLSNKIRFKEGGVVKNKDLEIKALVLSGEILNKFKQNNQLNKLNEKIKDSGQMANLDLSNQKIDISNDEFIDFLQCIKELKFLQNLSFRLKDDSLSKESLERLCQTIGSSSSALNQLHLEFNLSDEALGFLEEAFVPIASVRKVSLSFKFSKKISSEGLDQLKNGLISLTSLHYLSINFRKFNNISDEGLNSLMTSFPSLTSLQRLSLNVKNCIKISDEGLDYLKSGLMSLPSLLQLLSLNFSGCHQISDEGLSSLKEALISLKYLQHLDLIFTGCKEISNEGLNHLNLFPVTHLRNGRHRRNCSISNEGLHHLKAGLISLRSLRHLSLDFSWCNKISNKGLESLKEGLLPLKSLQKLSLHFELCKKISDEGLKHLHSSLISLTSLQHLTLNFTFCRKISSAGLNHLKSLMSLVSLKSLSLAFYGCENISDQGLKQFRNHPKCTTYISCKV